MRTHLALATLFVMPTAASAQFAEMTEPARVQGRVDSGAVAWTCKGRRCTPVSGAAQITREPMSACKALALQVGHVVRFSVGNRFLSNEELATCNRRSIDQRLVQASPGVRLPQDRILLRPTLPSPSPVRPSQPPSASGATPSPASAPPTPFPSPTSPAPSAAGDGTTGARASFRTLPIELTGTGSLGTKGSFMPMRWTTPAVELTGTGTLGTRGLFTPKSWTTLPIEATGTGSLK